MFDDLPEGFIYLLVVMVIGGAKWVMDRFRKTMGQGDDETPGSDLEDLYEEARREIFERQAREYPTEEELRRKLGGGQAPAIPPAIPSAPPQLSFIPAPSTAHSPPPIPGMPSARAVSRPALSKAEQDALRRLQARRSKTKSKSSRRRSRGKSRVRALLSTPSSARDAIVLAEILGPPRGA